MFKNQFVPKLPQLSSVNEYFHGYGHTALLKLNHRTFCSAYKCCELRIAGGYSGSVIWTGKAIMCVYSHDDDWTGKVAHQVRYLSVHCLAVREASTKEMSLESPTLHEQHGQDLLVCT